MRLVPELLQPLIQLVAEIAKKQLKPVIEMLKEIMNTDIPEIDSKLKGTDAPWTPGRVLEIDW